jgi:DNA-binding beta-propeller fold protein YncE
MPSKRTMLLTGALAVAVVAGGLAFWLTGGPSAPTSPLPLRTVHELSLPGDNSRFDYASLDAQRGLLFVAHLGASEVVEIDVRANKVVRTIPNLSNVHGVLVVPALHRVYATATGANQVVALSEDSGEVIHQAPTGNYPDGIAYDPRRSAVWTTNETGGTETVVDTDAVKVRGNIDMGGEVGNVVYDATSDRMLVDVQGRNDLAVIDPASLAITKRVALPGCDHDHGLALDTDARLAFVACDGNATLLTVDMNTWQVTGTSLVGADPDVLAYDTKAHRLYVACESGTVSVLDVRDGRLVVAGSDHLADGAHVVAVDPGTHRSYYPVPAGSDGRPALLERESTP